MEHFKLTVIACAGIVLLLAGCTTAPEATAEKTVDIVQSDSSYERGKYYLAKGYNGLALNHFITALHHNPGDVPIMNAVAITYQRLDRPDMARSVFEKALNLNSNSSQTLNNLGYFYLSSGKPEKALKFFKAIGRDQEHAQIAAANLEFVEQALAKNAMIVQASLAIPIEEPVSKGRLEDVSLERVSEKVYVLNSRYNSTYQNAVIRMKLDPRLIVRSAYTE